MLLFFSLLYQTVMNFRHGRCKPLSDKENSRNSRSAQGQVAGATKEDVERWRRAQVTNLYLTRLANIWPEVTFGTFFGSFLQVSRKFR